MPSNVTKITVLSYVNTLVLISDSVSRVVRRGGQSYAYVEREHLALWKTETLGTVKSYVQTKVLTSK